MTKKTTKRALLLSALSLLMCVTMLIGSTFAWFTDSVTSAGNIIKSGNLELNVSVLDKESGSWNSIRDNNDMPIFTHQNWEPGYVDVKVLKIENEGSLALKWYAKFLSDVAMSPLADVIDVYVKEGITAYPADRNLDGWTGAGTVREFVNTPNDVTTGTLAGYSEEYLGIALKMRESAGNEYQELTLGAFDILILATQQTAEVDSFNELYDQNAQYPQGKPTAVGVTYQDINFQASLSIPAEAEEGEYEVKVPKESIVITSNDGKGSLAFDMYLERNGEKATPIAGVEYTVTIQLPHPFMKVTQVLHNGEPVQNFTHVPNTDVITFTTNSFSPFEIIFDDYTDASSPLEFDVETKIENGEEVKVYTITDGLFINVNPADYDKTLKEENSKYIVASYVKDGKTYYNVSQRDSTYFVTNDSTMTQLVDVNGEYPITYVAPGQLYKFFSDLQTKEFCTVYLLPGTYNEGTVIGIYSSMDIIGLGDTDEVKVIKVSGSNSNKHLFNCSGTKADYIQVTLRNMYLDASVNNLAKNSTTSYTQDNAAVQSIRKTKVKCFDLTVVKDTSSFGYAFYVNANNDANGAYQHAYMYVEDCNLVVRGSSFAVSTLNGSKNAAGMKWYFYHSGLTINGQPYTTNSGNNKNVAMAADNWSWN